MSPFYPEVCPKIVCYIIMNCFTELKRVLQKPNYCAFEDVLDSKPQIVQKGHLKGPKVIKKDYQGSFIFCINFIA